MSPLHHKQCFIMVGYPGSGKSTLAEKIAQKCQCHYFSSDKARAELFGSARFDQAGDEVIAEQSRQAYQYMYNQAHALLKNNQKVVLDGTHLDTAKRMAAVKLMLSTIPAQLACYVTVNPPLDVIDQRMAALKHTLSQGTENYYEAWKRVVGYFLEREKRGLLSWPDVSEGIESLNYETVYAALDG